MCFGPGLVAVDGEQHRRQRRMMQPCFGRREVKRLEGVFGGVAREVRFFLRLAALFFLLLLILTCARYFFLFSSLTPSARAFHQLHMHLALPPPPS